MRVLRVEGLREFSIQLSRIHSDPYGIKIMAPKGILRLVSIPQVSNIAANILKQEMLSLGGDAALARGVLTGEVKKSECILIGTLADMDRLSKKLAKQPFGLENIGKQLSLLLKNFLKSEFIIPLGECSFVLGRFTRIMGVLNVTPDSFSADGILSNGKIDSYSERALKRALEMIKAGAALIDVGGESSRPGAAPVSVQEELFRVIPVIKALAKKTTVPISIDTRKPEVAEQALRNGAVMINDIGGLRSAKMLKVAGRYKAGVVIMHMKGNPPTMQKKPHYDSLIDEVYSFLGTAVEKALKAGISRDKLLIDPGIGFGKTTQNNLEILKRLSEFKGLGLPILVGTSRKAFLGSILGVMPQERLMGTVASCIVASQNGACVVRVHDVKEVAQALKVFDTISAA